MEKKNIFINYYSINLGGKARRNIYLIEKRKV